MFCLWKSVQFFVKKFLGLEIYTLQNNKNFRHQMPTILDFPGYAGMYLGIVTVMMDFSLIRLHFQQK